MASNDPKKIYRLVDKLKKAVDTEVNDRLPRKVGIIAVQHFKQNFRDSGFMDGTLHPWKKAKRQLSGGLSASARYKTLTSARNHLMNSVQSAPGRGQVTIENRVPYARIHNEGGEVRSSPTITPQMRKFAWAMFFKTAGRRGGGSRANPRGRANSKAELPEEARKWKALALTKKTRIQIRARMPKRQFIGESRELTQKVNKEINDRLKKISDGISTK